MRGLRGSSPRLGLGRRMAGRGSSMWGAKFGEDGDGGRRSVARFRPGCGSAELDDGRRRFGARLRGLWREKIEQSGEERLGRSPAAARVARLGSARRELGKGEERMELDTNIEESGEASSRRHSSRRLTRGGAPTSRPAVTVAVWATQWSTGRNSSRVGLILTHALPIETQNLI